MKLVLLLFISSCSWLIGDGASISAKKTHYTVSFTSPEWNLKKDDRSDYIYENKNDGRILLSNSFCKEFQDQPLDSLAKKTAKTVDKFKATKKEYTTFQNREAYRMEGIGSVDGVTVFLKLLNTRRNNCYFDFIAISPEKAEVIKSHSDFEHFLNSVEFKK